MSRTIWLLLASLAPAAVAGETTPAIDAGARRTLELFPAGELYPPYLADLHRPGFGLVQVHAASTTVDDAGDRRFDLRLGGSFGLLRLRPRDRPDRGWQLDVVAGFDGQFDVDRSYDNIGWDGNYGLSLVTARDHGLAFKVGVYHTSSHVGDEYAERTGRRRIGYTREELVAGLSWTPAARWRLYAETGWAYDRRNEELQEPGRLQAGVEHTAPATLWGGRLGWFAAADLSATEERDRSVDASIQAGLLVLSGPRRWRLAAGFYDGRSTLGEFFQDDERFLTLGLWLDL
jgi:hypothetical protein